MLKRIVWGPRGGWRGAVRIVVLLGVIGGMLYGVRYAVSYARLQHTFAASNAARLCAGLFLSGRTPEEINDQSLYKEGLRKDRYAAILNSIYDSLTTEIDRQKGIVTVDGLLIRPVVASYQADRGCVLDRDTSHAQTPKAVTYNRIGKFTVLTRAELPEALAKKLDDEVARNFADPEHATHALLVYKNGVLIRETYAAAGGPDFRAESWSLGKTIVGTLVGKLIAEGALSLDEPIQISQWPEGDPRRKILLRHAMGMSGGLRFSTGFKTFPFYAQGDHGLVYTDLDDVVRFVTDRPLEHAPGSFGTYNNADPLLMLEFIRQKLKLDNDQLRQLIREKVFAPLNMDVVLSTDPKGFPIITGYVYGTARSWASLGLLYANKGALDGKPFLASGFVDFVATPSSGYPKEAYGGMLWLNRHAWYPWPPETLVMSGAGDQVVAVLPADGIVIVRMGHRNKSSSTGPTMRDSIKNIIALLRAK